MVDILTVTLQGQNLHNGEAAIGDAEADVVAGEGHAVDAGGVVVILRSGVLGKDLTQGFQVGGGEKTGKG